MSIAARTVCARALHVCAAAAVACFAVACTDVGVIGESSACGSACGDGLVCNPDEGRCVECTSTDDCGADVPLCSAAHECVQCLEEGDCAGDATCRTGACVPRDHVDAGDDDEDDHEQHEEGEEAQGSDDAMSGDASAEGEDESAEEHGL